MQTWRDLRPHYHRSVITETKDQTNNKKQIVHQKNKRELTQLIRRVSQK